MVFSIVMKQKGDGYMSESSYKILLRQHLKQHDNINEKLFDYVAQNANQVLYFSFEQLRDVTACSTEELFAFFQAFSMDSLESFKEVLRNIIYYEATPLGTVERSLSSIATEMVLYEMRNLTTFSAQLDCEKIERLADDILSASEVILFGSRNTGSTYASVLARKLKHHHINVRLITNNTSNACLTSVSASALVIAFGVSLYRQADILQLRLLRDQNIRIVSFTDRSSSPFALLSDYYFTLPALSFDNNDSLTTGLLFTNLISLCISLRDRKKTIADKNAFWASCEDLGLFS